MHSYLYYATTALVPSIFCISGTTKKSPPSNEADPSSNLLLFDDGYDAGAVYFYCHAVAGFDERQLLVDGYFSYIDGFCIPLQ